MKTKTDTKELEKEIDSTDETETDEELVIEVVDEESASDSDNVLQLIVSYERVLTEMSVDDYLALSHRNIEKSKEVLSHYVGDGNGRFLEPEDAIKLIGEISLLDLTNLITQFFNKMNEVVVPKVNGSDSKST